MRPYLWPAGAGATARRRSGVALAADRPAARHPAAGAAAPWSITEVAPGSPAARAKVSPRDRHSRRSPTAGTVVDLRPAALGRRSRRGSSVAEPVLVRRQRTGHVDRARRPGSSGASRWSARASPRRDRRLGAPSTSAWSCSSSSSPVAAVVLLLLRSDDSTAGLCACWRCAQRRRRRRAAPRRRGSVAARA